MSETQNCHGCKWLDEVKNEPKGSGYCSRIVLSRLHVPYSPEPEDGAINSKVRRPSTLRCELYEAGDFATRYSERETR